MVVMVADSRILIDRRKTLLSNVCIFTSQPAGCNFLVFLITFWIGLYILFQDAMYQIFFQFIHKIRIKLRVHLYKNQNYLRISPKLSM